MTAGMRVVIVGQGYVGLPLAVRAAQVGHTVIGYDVDAERVKRLAAGESYVDDVTSAELQSVLDSGSYRPSPPTRTSRSSRLPMSATPSFPAKWS